MNDHEPASVDRVPYTDESVQVHPEDLRRQLGIDAALRRAAITAIAAIFILLAVVPSPQSETAAAILLLACGGLWLALSLTTARTARQMAHFQELAARDPRGAEALLRTLMRRYPLHRSVRLLLHYRVASLRHRQMRFDVASPLCQAILAERRGVPREARAHLLAMLVEASLYHGDTWGAYHALSTLHAMKLTLNETLERMALQVNYEIAVGRDDLPLESITTTLAMAELLPPPLFGALHVTLWAAAARCGHTALADWLLARAHLLCSEDQIRQLAQGAWMPKVAERPH